MVLLIKIDKENKINYFFCFFFYLYVSVRLNIKHTMEEEYVDSENQTTYKSFKNKQTNKENKLTY
jgi:hypothetical protein